MFPLQLLYAGVVAMMALIGMVTTHGLNTYQALDLVAIPTFFFFRALYTEVSRPVPQANVQVASSGFLSSVTSGVPVTITDLIVRPPSLVPSVIVPTIKDLAIIPTTCSALLTLKDFHQEFSQMEEEDVCEWPSAIPITLLNVCDVVAAPAAPPATPTSVTSPAARPVRSRPPVELLPLLFVVVFTAMIPLYTRFMFELSDNPRPLRHLDVRSGLIVLDDTAVAENDQTRFIHGEARSTSMQDSDCLPPGAIADSNQGHAIVNSEVSRTPKSDCVSTGVVVLDGPVADSTKAQSLMNGGVQDQTFCENLEESSSNNVEQRVDAPELDEINGEQAGDRKQRKKRRAKKKVEVLATVEEDDMPIASTSAVPQPISAKGKGKARADEAEEDDISTPAPDASDPQESDWITVGTKGKGKARQVADASASSQMSQQSLETEPVASTSTQAPDQPAVNAATKKRRRKRGGVRSQQARARRSAAREEAKEEEKEDAVPEARDFPVLTVANTFQVSKTRQRLWKPVHAHRTAYEKNLEKLITPTILFDNEIPDLEQFWVLKKRPLRPAVQRPMPDMLPPVVPYTEDDVLLVDTVRELHSARWSSRSSYASILKDGPSAT
ncbi:hypothetical protein EIP91_006763 [Steccherinum ochraceum]|uniref:Uncharacterized protein n=1 Tax=Steccherinum ochraceum TaxID=92696 RepID=A0A4R0R7S1_9APHY|nr:hypothetical protein EIP91_006763 [Steccherinum ochraceum]